MLTHVHDFPFGPGYVVLYFALDHNPSWIAKQNFEDVFSVPKGMHKCHSCCHISLDCIRRLKVLMKDYS